MFINIFDNSYTEGISGGNVRSAHIFKNIKKLKPDINLRIVTSKNGQIFYQNFDLFEKTLIVSKEKTVINFYCTYFYRLCRLIFWVFTAKFKQQVIYANSDYLVDVIPAFLSKIFYKSTWVQVCQLIIDHPGKRENSFSNYIAYYLQRASFFLIKISDLVITDGYTIRDFLVNQYKFNPQLVKVGFLGVDLEAVNQATPIKEAIDLIFVGTLDKRKGIENFIGVCKSLINDGMELKATIVAEKTDKINKLQKIVNQFGITNNINFIGKLGQTQVFSYLKSSKILLFPSYNESWGLVICEAIACGVLPIVKSLSVYKKIYEDNIIYCNSDDDFYKMTRLYLRDDSLRKELVNKAKSFIGRYSWKNVAERELSFFGAIK